MASLSGGVSHFGRNGCREFCKMSGRRQEDSTHYYPARFLPENFNVPQSNHPDIDITIILDQCTSSTAKEHYEWNLKGLMSTKTRQEYEAVRLATGLAKPSLVSSLPDKHKLPLPGCFPGDIMHLPCLNIPDLFLSLYRGTLKLGRNAADDPKEWPWAVLKGDTWTEYGKEVGDCQPFLPGSFDKAPQDISKAINSGFKAWEHLITLFVLSPALFHGILPQPYYGNFCKLVRFYQIMMQHSLLPSDIQYADQLYTDFSDEYEAIFIQRKSDRIPMACQSIHAGSHYASNTYRLGPLMNVSQWTMERVIRLLTELIRSHISSFANLCQISQRVCQINALVRIIPDLAVDFNKSKISSRAYDAGDGYYLLQPRDRVTRKVSPEEAAAIRKYLVDAELRVPSGWGQECPPVRRWGGVLLPNTQRARSLWTESKQEPQKIRMARNVKVRLISITTLRMLKVARSVFQMERDGLWRYTSTSRQPLKVTTA
jgi:hypothetical protein